MKKCAIIITILLVGLILSIHTIAQDELETKAKKLIEVEGEEGRILVIPTPISGPAGQIIKFVVFGTYKTPEVVIEIASELLSAIVTTIEFKEGYLFSGWFDVPKQEITNLWINGNSIPWKTEDRKFG